MPTQPPPPQTDKTSALLRDTIAPGVHLTTNQGVIVSDDQNALKVGARGPTLLEDFHLREKLTHFDHERIPERVVHARGAGAHGVFRLYEDLSNLTTAGVLTDTMRETPVFVRFSTVAGSRGSTDLARDARGFAVKLYTAEGVWDLVGNNMPVFFIQDAVKFPDLIHALKPEPDNEIPQAASAHDTFWDFISLTPESAHMLMWVMSDRAIPRSYAMMEGFGVHTFKLVAADGHASFVKFHWKPVKGVRSLVWDEAQKLSGQDPDFHRRDLFEAIERGDFPEWDLGLQVVPESDEHNFDFDLLDPTKLIPEELVPVRRVGRMTLTRNPANFFAETEQVAFHSGHIVPGMDFTNDPLLQGRLFSYLDTQLRRVGPNFHELPINRSLAPVANYQRDAMARTTIDPGKVSYFPNRLGGGCPMHGGAVGFVSHDGQREVLRKTHDVGLATPSDEGPGVDGAERAAVAKVRARSPSFADHFSQATQFWNSMSDWERDHIVEAFSFELNNVVSDVVRHHVMNEILVNIDDGLAAEVGRQTGIVVARIGTAAKPTPSAPSPSGPLRPEAKMLISAALSQDVPTDASGPSGTIRGRKVALLGGDGIDATHLALVRRALAAEGARVELVAPRGGMVTDSSGATQVVDRAQPNAPSVIYDAVIIAGGSAAELAGPAVHFVNEAYRHGKPIAALGDGKTLLDDTAVEVDDGVIVGDGPDTLTRFVDALKRHRFPRRATEEVPA